MSGYIEHFTKAGTRWDQLAWQYYGDATAAEVIVRANPDVPIWPVLPSGVRILIPVLEQPTPAEIDTEGLPPWLM